MKRFLERLFRPGRNKGMSQKKALWFCKKGFDVSRADWPPDLFLTWNHSRYQLCTEKTVVCGFWTPRQADKRSKDWYILP